MLKTKSNFIEFLPLFMVIFIDVMGMVLVLPVLTPLILQANSPILPADTTAAWRDFIYGFSLAIFPIFMFFSTPILGDLSDKFGRKTILLTCLLGTAISYIVAGFGILANSLTILLFSRVLAGLAAGTQPIASAAIIDMSSSETKTRNLSWVVLVSSIGIIFGPLLGGLTADQNILHWFGYETPFFIAAAMSLANAIYLFFYYQEKSQVRSDQPIQITKGFRLFMSAFIDKHFRLLALIFFTFVLAWGLYFQAISWFFMEVYHYGAGKIGLFIGFIGLIFAIATSLIARVVLKWFANEMNAFLFFIFLMVIANIGCTLTHSEVSQWLWVILNASGNVICYTVALSLFSSIANKESQGWIMGVAGAIGAFTWGVAGIISGPLGYLEIRVPLLTSGLLCLISFVLMIIYRSNQKRR